jgi:hypothetical protein
MDANGDREISRAEWRGTARSFTFHDWNRDNRLSGDELRVGDRGDRFDDLDANRNGRVDRNEWQGSAAVFSSLDRNGDGALTRAEAGATETGKPGAGKPGAGAAAGVRGKPNAVMVPATRAWTDTGITIQPGEILDVTASGQIFYSRNKSAVAPASGAAGRRATPAAPMPEIEIGALIGRIGDGPLFFVGETMEGYRAQTAGRLFLRVNDDILTDNQGEFRAVITVTRR